MGANFHGLWVLLICGDIILWMHWFSVSVGKFKLSWLFFVEDVNSLMRASHEYMKIEPPQFSINDSTEIETELETEIDRIITNIHVIFVTCRMLLLVCIVHDAIAHQLCCQISVLNAHITHMCTHKA